MALATPVVTPRIPAINALPCVPVPAPGVPIRIVLLSAATPLFAR